MKPGVCKEVQVEDGSGLTRVTAEGWGEGFDLSDFHLSIGIRVAVYTLPP